MASVSCFISVLIFSSFYVKAEIEGQIRLTGLAKAAGRLEIFLNGEWGSVSGQASNSSSDYPSDLYLAYGKTVCFQINHYNGDDNKVITGSVSELNQLLKRRGLAINVTGLTEHISIHDLQCGSWMSLYPRHILRCSYEPGAGSQRKHSDDLAVLCDYNVSNFDYPFIGQVRLNSDSADGVIQGTLEIYSGTEWGNVCYNNFNQGAADTVCRQLGYTNAESFGPTTKQTTSITWLDSISCSPSDKCLWECLRRSQYKDLYENKTKNCSKKEYVTLNCTFDISKMDTATSPFIGNACQLPPYSATNNFIGIIIITVAVGLFIVILIAGTLCVVICLCCLIPSSYLYQWRTKPKYGRCNTADNPKTV